MTTIKGILIDAVKREVREVEVEGLRGLQEAVGGLITIAHSFINDKDEETDTLFVDDDGLLKGPKYFFVIEGAHQPFAGNGLIVGIDPAEGDTVSTTQKIEAIKAQVSFHSLDEVRRMVD
jgi:hypothetical protein